MVQLAPSAHPVLQFVPEHVTASQDSPVQLDHEVSAAEQSGPVHPVSQSGPVQVV